MLHSFSFTPSAENMSGRNTETSQLVENFISCTADQLYNIFLSSTEISTLINIDP